jgi:hypothetical protein
VDPSNTSLSREEIEFLRELAKTDNVMDVEILSISNRIRLKYNFREEIGFLLCRELGMYSKLPRGIEPPPISKLTDAQWEFIDKCREWITAHQTCPRCKSKAGQRKRIFSSKEAAILFSIDRDTATRNFQTAYVCPHGNGWHLRTEIVKAKENNEEDTQIQNSNIVEKFDATKDKTVSHTSDKLANEKNQEISRQTKEKEKEKEIDFSKIKFLAAVDKMLVSYLKQRAKNLDLPKNQLQTLRDVAIWSGRSIPIEAYFIAIYKGVVIEKIEITSDDTLMKLRGWLLAAGKNPHF